MPKFPVLSAFILFLTACGSYKAVRPDAPVPQVAETPNYSVNYEAAGRRKITAVYLNNNSPMAVVLKQGNTEEMLTQKHSLTKSAEYANATTRWTVQDGFATLVRKGKTVVFREIP